MKCTQMEEVERNKIFGDGEGKRLELWLKKLVGGEGSEAGCGLGVNSDVKRERENKNILKIVGYGERERWGIMLLEFWRGGNNWNGTIWSIREWRRRKERVVFFFFVKNSEGEWLNTWCWRVVHNETVFCLFVSLWERVDLR